MPEMLKCKRCGRPHVYVVGHEHEHCLRCWYEIRRTPWWKRLSRVLVDGAVDLIFWPPVTVSIAALVIFHYHVRHGVATAAAGVMWIAWVGIAINLRKMNSR